MWLASGVPNRFLLITAVVVGGAALLAATWDVLTVPRQVSVFEGYTIIGVAIAPLFVLTVWLAHRRPEHPQSRRLLLFVTGIEVMAGIVSEPVRHLYAEPVPPAWFWAGNLFMQCVAEVVLITGIGMLASYPDGVVEHRWQRIALRLLWLHVLAPPLLLLTDAELLINPHLINPAPAVPSPFAVPALAWLNPAVNAVYLGFFGLLIGAVVFWVRYAQAAPAQRDRMRAMVRASAVFLPLMVVVNLGLVVMDAPVLILVASAVLMLTILALPVIIAVGIARHQLFDLDAAVRRSLVFGALSLVIGTSYLVAVAAPGIALGESIPVQAAVLVTIVAAMVVQPLRSRLERLAGRIVFGSRVDRYRLLTDFGARVEQALDTDDLLPQLAGTVRTGLAASWVRVRLPDAEVTAGPVEGAAELTVPLRHRGEVIGHIECGPTEAGYSRHDRDLLTTLAHQSAVALANVDLTARLNEQVIELARSRARIIAAQDTERQRIERNIHDGAQQHVAALIMKMRLARNQLDRGDRDVHDVLDELQRDAADLGADLRELAQGIHPTVLVDHGLVAAVQARADKLPLPHRVIADQTALDTRFDPNAEAAVYFVVCEALTNAVKHSGARGVEITLAACDGKLRAQVSDDGTGIPTAASNGHGLLNMRDRAEALHGTLDISSSPGAGTTVRIEIPSEEPRD